MSITKRHYNNGYYVAFNDGKQPLNSQKGEEKAIQTKTVEPLQSASDNTEYNSKKFSGQNTITNNNVVAVRNAMHLKSNSHLSPQQVLKQKIKIIKDGAAQIKHALSETKEIKQESSERTGRSLFWIAILAILILWALGFLAFGLGELIHLLLVIALILLILWLFGVV